MRTMKRIINSLTVVLSLAVLLVSSTGTVSALTTATTITPPKKCQVGFHYNVYAYANPSDADPNKLTADSYRTKPDGQPVNTDAVIATAVNSASYTDVTFRTRAGGAQVELLCGEITYLAGLTTPNWYYINQSLTFTKQADGSYLAQFRVRQTADKKLLTSHIYARDYGFPPAQ